MRLEDPGDRPRVAGHLQRHPITRIEALGEQLQLLGTRLDPARRPQPAAFDDRHLAVASYHHPYTVVRSATVPRHRGERLQVGAPIVRFNGAVIRMSVDDIKRSGRSTQGVIVMRLRGDETVSSLAPVVEADEEEEPNGEPDASGE